MPTMLNTRNVDTVLSQSKVINMENKIWQLMPDAAPVITMLMKAGKQSVDNPTFYHRELEEFPRWVTFTEADAADQTDPKVSDAEGEYFSVPTSANSKWGVQLFVPRTGEIMLVTAESAGTLTVVRGVGGTTAAAILANDAGYILGMVNREDATAPEPNMVKEVLKTWYTQPFRNSTEVTWAATATKMYHGNDRVFQQKVAGIKHKVDMELQLLLGGTGASTDHDSASVRYRYSAGLNGIITSHNVEVPGIFSEPILWGAMEDASEHHHGDWLFLGGPPSLSAINSWPLAKMQISPLAEKYGVNLKMIVTPHGDLHIARESLLRGNELGGWAFLIPMPVEDFIKYRPLVGNGENFDTKIKLDIKKDDNPTVHKDEWYTEMGLQVHEESKFVKFTNIHA